MPLIFIAMTLLIGDRYRLRKFTFAIYFDVFNQEWLEVSEHRGTIIGCSWLLSVVHCYHSFMIHNKYIEV